MDWRDLNRFPLASGQWQGIRPPSKRRHEGEVHVAKMLRRWHPFDPLIVATPTSYRFAPPVCLPDIAHRVHRTALIQARFLVFLLFAFIILLATAWLLGIGNTAKVSRLLGATSACMLYVVVDYLLFLRHLPRARERALFVNFVYQHTHGVMLPLISLLLIGGLLQSLLQPMAGGLEPFVRRYGILFSSAMAGEYWRYVIGSFIHSGPAHWLTNFATLTVVAGIAGAIGRQTLVYHFGYLIVTALAVNLLPAGSRPEALVGVSGAIFGLFGWIIGIAYSNQTRFPQYFFVLIALFALLSVGLALLLAPKASNTAHLAGLLAGFIVGMLNIGVRQEFREQNSAVDN